MENIEKKKGNGIFIIIIILLLLVIGGLTFIVLKDKGIVNIGNKTKVVQKTTKKDTTKKESTTKETNNIEESDDSNFRIYSGENLTENKDFGKVKFNDKEVNIKFDKGDGAKQKLYVGEKYIEIVNSGLNNIAIMGNYLVLGLDGSGYRFMVYDQSLQEVETLGNSLGLLTNTTPDYTKWILDEHNLIYYNCNNDTLETYNLQIDGSNILKVLLTSNKEVACTAQR